MNSALPIAPHIQALKPITFQIAIAVTTGNIAKSAIKAGEERGVLAWDGNHLKKLNYEVGKCRQLHQKIEYTNN